MKCFQTNKCILIIITTALKQLLQKYKMTALPVLPQYLINIIYQFNSDHRASLESSLNQIQDKCICKTCNEKCELDFCLKPTGQVFCSEQCMSFWNAMQTNEWINEDADDNDFVIQDQNQNQNQEQEQEEQDHFIYDYLE